MNLASHMRKPLERLPDNGPVILTIPGITDVSVNANTVGPEVKWSWPKSYIVEGLWLSTRNPTVIEIANTKLRMVDEEPCELSVDGNGFTTRMSALQIIGRGAPLLGVGVQFRWYAFRRLVKAGETWIFQIENQNAAAITPWLGFRVAELVGR